MVGFPQKLGYLCRFWWCLWPSPASLPFNFFSSSVFKILALRPRICSDSYMPSWENPFPVPQPGQEPVVVEKARSTFTIEKVVTRVNTNLCSSINVEHMQSRMLIGKMFG
ncbi:hypothetical protein D8674_005487 [Pyrus ussuriensis x Pyrus communis]|uniref:Uncharacterized protein n=1 Tax=Pyrus ussuriensis x Pyrus communis TaxID=2448454 RepID=A0A5N5FWL0_9ROSA|nr:hypothetical protein D8674_005487 [Pyrus ussuriensis x Pyrus communis]